MEGWWMAGRKKELPFTPLLAFLSQQFTNSDDQRVKVKVKGVGNLSLLQGIFPTQESNPGLPHCRQILDQLSHKGSLIK